MTSKHADLNLTHIYAATGFEGETLPFFKALEAQGMRPVFYRDPTITVATAVYVPKRFRARFEAFQAGWEAARQAARLADEERREATQAAYARGRAL